MEKTELEELRQSIREEYEKKIDQLKKDMANELKAVSRLESRVAGGASKAKEGIRMIRTKPPGGTVGTTREYIKKALTKIEGEFTRSKIKEMTNIEAGVKIKDGTFAPIFASLVKKGAIVEVGQEEGSRTLLYKRGNINIPTESSQVGLFGNGEGKGEEC